MWIYWWLEDQSWLIGWENWSLIIDILRRWFIVPDYLIWIDTRCSWWLLKLSAGRFISIVFSTSMRFWDGYIYEIVYWLEVSGLLLYWFMLLKVTGKILLDRNTFIVILFYRYTVILFTLLLLYWYCYCHCIVPVIEIIWILIVINDNVNWQLTLGLKKLMEEIASVFWVDLGYRLHSRVTVPLQGSGGWLTSRIVHIVIVIDTLLLLLTT